ncbi:hypothetical protein VTH82DRAFT_7685 [Thermothelomyces myriococcoides]
MTSRIPHLLEPYLSLPPESSLVLLTGVLGASTNWLVLRHLYALLRSAPKPSSDALRSAVASLGEVVRRGIEGTAASASSSSAGEPNNSKRREWGRKDGEDEDEDDDREAAVVLVSFLRDFTFWRDGLARLGIDLEAAGRRGRFAYVDGLPAGGLFSGGGGSAAGAGAGAESTAASLRQQGWRRTAVALAGPGDIRDTVLACVEQLKKNHSPRQGVSSSAPSGDGSDGTTRAGRKVVLVIDGLDFVLAAMDPNSRPGGPPEAAWTATGVKEVLTELREATHAAIVTLAADDPLIKEQETTLEKQHAWFALSLAHEADTVLSLRLLDTGAAQDVSGVIRITNRRAPAQNHEYLYHVGGDGAVRVFERGQ